MKSKNKALWGRGSWVDVTIRVTMLITFAYAVKTLHEFVTIDRCIDAGHSYNFIEKHCNTVE
ncbi:hypothetical protein SKA34_09768 [Photobacterium sp. SKA34]|uniref:hypothetical protein n=1 Tax=Photobacterium sp. SKA34 TaxID=121723 RepID=UPI00006AF7D6|nr:hypothetical protein [Photobacterium sp. SKA34]EAR54998.1 hypothetical protein SKA34_09768 [Photobacterium sp. SKA34]